MNLREKLIKLADKAYDGGLYGYEELKESFIEKLVAEFELAESKENPIDNTKWDNNTIKPPSDPSRYIDFQTTQSLGGATIITARWLAEATQFADYHTTGHHLPMNDFGTISRY